MDNERYEKRTRKYYAGASYAFGERDLLGFDLVQHSMSRSARLYTDFQ